MSHREPPTRGHGPGGDRPDHPCCDCPHTAAIRRGAIAATPGDTDASPSPSQARSHVHDVPGRPALIRRGEQPPIGSERLTPGRDQRAVSLRPACAGAAPSTDHPARSARRDRRPGWPSRGVRAAIGRPAPRAPAHWRRTSPDRRRPRPASPCVEHLSVLGVHIEPKGRHVLPGERVEIDAASRDPRRVERVDERGAVKALVERVGTPAVWTHCPRHGGTAHLLVGRSRIDDRLRQESGRSHIEGPHAVPARVTRRRVVDEVKR